MPCHRLGHRCGLCARGHGADSFGSHDLERVIRLAEYFSIPIGIAVNKFDLNKDMTEAIELMADEKGIGVFGRIRYDRSVTDAMVHETSIIEYSDSGASEDIRALWERVSAQLGELY